MTAKEYLSQAYRLEKQTKAKLEQIKFLRSLADDCTNTLSDMPKNPSPSVSRMADTVGKIVDLENEVKDELEKLIDLKRKTLDLIYSIENINYSLILEKRYLYMRSWLQISDDMNYDIHWLYKLHNRALEDVQKKLDDF